MGSIQTCLALLLRRYVALTAVWALGITTQLVVPALLLVAPERAAVARTSDAAAEALFQALRGRDYSGAVRLFDAKMKAALPEAKLRKTWEEQIVRFGAFVDWKMQTGDPAQGFDIRLAALHFTRGELKAMVAIDPATGSVAGFFIRPATAPAATPAAYVDSTKFRAVETGVGPDSLRLGATLTLPVGTGPFPAAVLVHGSGPHDRDETVGANRVFRDLAEGLSSRGIAVLRYDKRTFRYPGQMKAPSIDEEVVLDAMAAVATLRSRPEIDPNRIVVIGHSLGALLAPEIAVRSAPVAGVALLAPPGRPPWEIVLAQMRYLGAPASEIEDAERKAALLAKGTLGTDTFAGAPQAYWRDWASRDGVAMARKLGRPVLLLHGDRDFQVGDEDVAVWKKGLEGVPRAEIVSLPGLNHLFLEGSGKPGLAEYETPGHVDARVIDALAAFITR